MNPDTMNHKSKNSAIKLSFLFGGLKDLTQLEQKIIHSAFYDLISVSDDRLSYFAQAQFSAVFCFIL
jgi:hypothetical protein